MRVAGSRGIYRDEGDGRDKRFLILWLALHKN